MIPLVLLAAVLLLASRPRGGGVGPSVPRQGNPEDRANLLRDIDSTSDPAALEQLALWAEYFGFPDLAAYARGKGIQS
ncbi:MAG: hypothetical protein EBR82_81930 [Caulobacteraceae bacterium]|nr:hypothetical protein [Caulobacteraceae bacterium]